MHLNKYDILEAENPPAVRLRQDFESSEVVIPLVIDCIPLQRHLEGLKHIGRKKIQHDKVKFIIITVIGTNDYIPAK